MKTKGTLGKKEAVEHSTVSGQMELPAKEIFRAISAHSGLEMDLQEFFDGTDTEVWKRKNFQLNFHHQTYDDYDGSIEIYLRAETKFNEAALLSFLKNRGFTYGWINYSDGTDQHFGSSFLHPRQVKEHPRWSKEQEAEDLTPATFINYRSRAARRAEPR